jgi:hypothetical protein
MWFETRSNSEAMHILRPCVIKSAGEPYGIKLSHDAIRQYIHRYQVMLAARQQDPDVLRQQ